MGIATKPLKSLPSDEQSFSELLDRHRRHIGYIGAALIIAIGGGWLYARSKAIKTQRADEAYRKALQSVYAGNVPLAQSDLKQMSVRYAGTPSGTAGAMTLAKLYYEQGKYQDGITALQRVADQAGDMAYDVHALIAAGYEGMGKNLDAAKSYETAAVKARFDADRDEAKASAARDYEAAGQREPAIKIWTEIAKNPKSVLAEEAQVRLGELEARVVKA